MERLLKINDIADLLQVSRRTIYDWIHVGFIPHYRFPKGIRFREVEIERWLKKRLKKGRSTYKKQLNDMP